MIVNRYLIREIGAALLGVSVLLLLIFLSSTFVRILADAAEGEFPAGVVMSLFGLKALSNLVIIVQLAFFLAIMTALGRLYRDNEMTVMLACGVSPWRVLGVVAAMALVVSILSAVFSLYVSPWAEDRNQAVLDRAAASAEIEGIVPGRFNQPSDGETLLYVEDVSEDRRRLEGIFVHSRGNEGESVILTADSGYQRDDRQTGERYLVLLNGHRYDGVPGRADFRMVTFDTHTVRIREREVIESTRRHKAKSTAELLKLDTLPATAELQRRISIAIAGLVLGLLAVPLSRTDPRQGRYAKLFMGILLYIIYSNLLTVAETWVSKGRIDPRIGMWWVHALMLSIALFQVSWQNGAFAKRRTRNGSRR